jgi:hypothetical protein
MLASQRCENGLASGGGDGEWSHSNLKTDTVYVRLHSFIAEYTESTQTINVNTCPVCEYLRLMQDQEQEVRSDLDVQHSVA